jgi:S-(hydroxymethyl)mycothiol dehydrogenase
VYVASPADAHVDRPGFVVEWPGGVLKSSWYGDCVPSRDFPMLIDLYLQGRLPRDPFVRETIGIDGVEAAFDKMHTGDVLRSVVVP